MNKMNKNERNERKKKSETRNDTLTEDHTSKNGLAPFHEGVIEMTENSEVPVVTKEARVVEEVSLNKEVREHDEKVKDTVRSTELDIEDLNDDRDRND